LGLGVRNVEVAAPPAARRDLIDAIERLGKGKGWVVRFDHVAAGPFAEDVVYLRGSDIAVIAESYPADPGRFDVTLFPNKMRPIDAAAIDAVVADFRALAEAIPGGSFTEGVMPGVSPLRTNSFSIAEDTGTALEATVVAFGERNSFRVMRSLHHDGEFSLLRSDLSINVRRGVHDGEYRIDLYRTYVGISPAVLDKVAGELVAAIGQIPGAHVEVSGAAP
jgi:hypothetical protein